MEKPRNRSFCEFFQKVVTIITQMDSVGYWQVYPNLIAAIRGRLKTFIHISPRIKCANIAQFF